MAQELDWFFSENPNGNEHGFSDAGMETFRKKVFESVARETIQNSLDARMNQRKPVHVDFSLHEMPASELPAVESLRDAMKRCRKFYQSNSKAVKFFDNAAKILRQRKIPILTVSDHNTRGLEGGDYERLTNWHSLVRAMGASSKSGGEGGSFGIGSSAPFAASQLRTVFYSTMTKQTKAAFVGVSRLTTHENSGGVKVNPNGHLGVDSGARVTSARLIPKFMQRKDCGTTVGIIGLTSSKSWKTEFALSVLTHFWPAIHFKKLTVTVDGGAIDSSNLETLLQRSSELSHFDAYEYYRCLDKKDSATKHLTEELSHLGEVKLHLRTGDPKLPNKVAMVRKPGMVVYRRNFRSPMKICGVLLCENDVGNEKLREMEPPEHNQWTGDLPEKGENKAVENELFSFVREQIKKLNEVDDSQALDIDGLGKFLPDDPEANSDKKNADEDGDVMPDNAEIPTSPIGSKPPRPTSDELGDIGPTSGSDDGPDDDSDDNEETESDSGPGSGQPPGDRKQVDVAIEARSFSQDKTGKKYSLVVRPSDKQKHVVDLLVRIVGEDKVDPVQIDSASLNGKEAKVDGGGLIRNVSLNARKSTELELVLAQPRRVALEVVAHED